MDNTVKLFGTNQSYQKRPYTVKFEETLRNDFSAVFTVAVADSDADSDAGADADADTGTAEDEDADADADADVLKVTILSTPETMKSYVSTLYIIYKAIRNRWTNKALQDFMKNGNELPPQIKVFSTQIAIEITN